MTEAVFIFQSHWSSTNDNVEWLEYWRVYCFIDTLVRTLPVQEVTAVLQLDVRAGKSPHIQRRLTCQSAPFDRIELDALNTMYILTVTLKILNRVERKCTAWIRTWDYLAFTRFHGSVVPVFEMPEMFLQVLFPALFNEELMKTFRW